MSKAWKFEDNLNTDEIIPARYNITIIPQELAKSVFCEIKPDYAKTVQPGDVIVGGQNFGCGSSREHAPIAIKGSGALCIIARSYARIFFRNAINIGLPILECSEAGADIPAGDNIESNLSTGEIFNRTNGHQYQAHPLPDFDLQIADAGGIVNFLKEHDIQDLIA